MSGNSGKNIFISTFLLIIFVMLNVLINKCYFYLVSSCIILIMLLKSFFLRDPVRKVPEEKGIIVSPADGKIIEIDPEVHLSSNGFVFTKIVIFLSLWNVHINRIPVEGKIVRINYQKGRFLPAFLKTSERLNENNSIELETSAGIFYIKQIAGLIARRIVCYLKAGDIVQTGQKFGIIKFGSRVELYLPKGIILTVRPGTSVKGGISIIGKMDGKISKMVPSEHIYSF